MRCPLRPLRPLHPLQKKSNFIRELERNLAFYSCRWIVISYPYWYKTCIRGHSFCIANHAMLYSQTQSSSFITWRMRSLMLESSMLAVFATWNLVLCQTRMLTFARSTRTRPYWSTNAEFAWKLSIQLEVWACIKPKVNNAHYPPSLLIQTKNYPFLRGLKCTRLSYHMPWMR